MNYASVLNECLSKTERENSHPGFSGKKDLSLKPEQICIVLGQDQREGHLGEIVS